jgi:putative DNA methylase
MPTEATNALKANMNALASSIVLVCRKRNPTAPVVTRTEFIRVLKRELPDAIDDIRKAGVGPVDMQQSVIGPGMGVKTALALINRAWEDTELYVNGIGSAQRHVASLDSAAR